MRAFFFLGLALSGARGGMGTGKRGDPDGAEACDAGAEACDATSLLQRSTVQAGPRHDDVATLQGDALFMMNWPANSGSAKTVADGCDSFKRSSDFLCEIEFPEHALVRDWIPPEATVMEFGARYGSTSCEIAKKLGNSGRLVSVEPDKGVWEALTKNIKANNCRVHVLRGVIGSRPLVMHGGGYGARTFSGAGAGPILKQGDFAVPNFRIADVEQALGLKFDTLLIDCEGCGQQMMDQIGPILKSQINLVLVEADMGDDGGDCQKNCMDYKKFFAFLEECGLEMVDKFNDCDRNRSRASKTSWCGSWINHYAFRRPSLP